MPEKIEISHRTIIFTVFFLIFLWFLFQIINIIVGLFVALVLMAALNPMIDRMEHFKVPRVLAIFLVYLLVFGFLGVVIAGIVPPLADQTGTLVANLPKYLEGVGMSGLGQRVIDSQIDRLVDLPSNIFKLSVSVFSNFLQTLILLVITFYLLLERRNLNRYIHILFGGNGEKRAEELISRVEKKLGGWVRAELTLMAIVAVMSYIGLRLLGIDFALPLALLAGILEIVPNIGPVISAIPAVLAGFMISPIMALAVVALYVLIQQIENLVIVPQVMAKEAGVNPLLTIISLAIGFEIGGVVGAILAVPVVLMLQILAAEVFGERYFKKV